jgi:energy-coupling factor transport system ATP-binding protein
MTVAAPSIRCEGLGFTYPGGRPALAGIDLDIAAGERVAIVGPNGSGKSTLVQHWNGLLRPTEGRILIGGAPIEERRVADLARTVGIAFQDPDRQVFARRCRDEVAFGARNVGVRGAALQARVDEALAAVALSDEAATNPYDLGRARRKLLAIASTLAMRTQIVILDEPTLGQDARGVALVQAIVSGLSASGRTVVAISHDRRFVIEAFERVVALDGGRVTFDGPVGEWPAPWDAGARSRGGSRRGAGTTSRRRPPRR